MAVCKMDHIYISLMNFTLWVTLGFKYLLVNMYSYIANKDILLYKYLEPYA